MTSFLYPDTQNHTHYSRWDLTNAVYILNNGQFMRSALHSDFTILYCPWQQRWQINNFCKFDLNYVTIKTSILISNFPFMLTVSDINTRIFHFCPLDRSTSVCLSKELLTNSSCYLCKGLNIVCSHFLGALVQQLQQNKIYILENKDLWRKHLDPLSFKEVKSCFQQAIIPLFLRNATLGSCLNITFTVIHNNWIPFKTLTKQT